MDQRTPPQASHAQGIEIGAVTTGITSFKALLSQKATPRKRTGARSVISKRTKIEPVARVQFEGESEEVKEEARKTETSINEPIDPAYLSRLSSAQQSIATTDPHSPLVITACPGSGKTATLVGRVIHLLRSGLPPSSILITSFSRKACGEIRDRLQQALPKQSDAVSICTLHSYAYGVLARHCGNVPTLPSRLELLTGEKQRDAIRQALLLAGKVFFSKRQEGKSWSQTIASLKMDGSILDGLDVEEEEVQEMMARSGAPAVVVKPSRTVVSSAAASGGGGSNSGGPRWLTESDSKPLIARCLRHIRLCKARNILPTAPSEAMKDSEGELSISDVLNAVYSLYSQILAWRELFDLGDLMPRAVRLWREHPQTLKAEASRYRHVLCDEFQDVNASQLELLTTLANAGLGLTVCGDDDQSIYGWRGALITPFKELQNRLAPASTAKTGTCNFKALVHCYRCPIQVVKASGSLIKHNRSRHPKAFLPHRTEEGKVSLLVCQSTTEEGTKLVDEIKKFQSQGGSTVVLCRSRMILRDIEVALRRGAVEYVLSSSRSTNEESKEGVYKTRMAAIFKSILELLVSPTMAIFIGFLKAINRSNLSQHLAHHHCHNVFAEGALTPVLQSGCISESDEIVLEDIVRKLAELHGSMNKVHSLILVNRIASAMSSLHGKGRLNAVDRHVVSLIMEDIERMKPQFKQTCSREEVEGLLRSWGQSAQASGRSGKEEGTEMGTAVELCTVHQSKGREWDHVFIPRLNEEYFPVRIFPSNRENPGPPDSTAGATNSNNIWDASMEEERRLCFVAMTRAKQSLVLSFSKTNGSAILGASRFIEEIPGSFLTPL